LKRSKFNMVERGTDTIIIVLTVCGNKTISEACDFIKSAVVLTRVKLHFIIFTDNPKMKSQIDYLVFNSIFVVHFHVYFSIISLKII
jgi:hypothetical protein